VSGALALLHQDRQWLQEPELDSLGHNLPQRCALPFQRRISVGFHGPPAAAASLVYLDR